MTLIGIFTATVRTRVFLFGVDSSSTSFTQSYTMVCSTVNGECPSHSWSSRFVSHLQHALRTQPSRPSTPLTLNSVVMTLSVTAPDPSRPKFFLVTRSNPASRMYVKGYCIYTSSLANLLSISVVARITVGNEAQHGTTRSGHARPYQAFDGA